MTKNNKKVIPENERLGLAKNEFEMGRDIAEEIYKSGENEPNENLLIRNFYYSVYHMIKGISILESGLDYSTHASLISYFNRNNKKSDFLKDLGSKWEIDESVNTGISTLLNFRDEYDYKTRFVDEDDYIEAERIWLHVFPKLDNLAALIIQNQTKYV